MNDNPTIKVGTFVDIHWEYITSEFGCRVLSTPAATGDCWQLELANGKPMNVQTFAKMVESGGSQR